jgi:hypothetical protein
VKLNKLAALRVFPAGRSNELTGVEEQIAYRIGPVQRFYETEPSFVPIDYHALKNGYLIHGTPASWLPRAQSDAVPQWLEKVS